MEYKEAIVVSCNDFKNSVEGVYIKPGDKNFMMVSIKGHTVRGYPEEEICPFFTLKGDKFLVILKNTALYDLLDTKVGLRSKLTNNVHKTINLDDIFEGSN